MILSDDDFAEIEAVYNSITTTYRIEFETLAENYRKNKVMLERNSRRLSNIHSKESDEVIKRLRLKKNDTEKAIQETDDAIRKLHEKTGESNLKLATLEKQIKDLSKRVSVDDADEKNAESRQPSIRSCTRKISSGESRLQLMLMLWIFCCLLPKAMK